MAPAEGAVSRELLRGPACPRPAWQVPSRLLCGRRPHLDLGEVPAEPSLTLEKMWVCFLKKFYI